MVNPIIFGSFFPMLRRHWRKTLLLPDSGFFSFIDPLLTDSHYELFMWVFPLLRGWLTESNTKPWKVGYACNPQVMKRNRYKCGWIKENPSKPEEKPPRRMQNQWWEAQKDSFYTLLLLYTYFMTNLWYNTFHDVHTMLTLIIKTQSAAKDPGNDFVLKSNCFL